MAFKCFVHFISIVAIIKCGWSVDCCQSKTGIAGVLHKASKMIGGMFGGSTDHVDCSKYNEDIFSCNAEKACKWWCVLKKHSESETSFDPNVKCLGKMPAEEQVIPNEVIESVSVNTKGWHYYEGTALLTWNKAGKVEEYVFDPRFIAYQRSKEEGPPLLVRRLADSVEEWSDIDIESARRRLSVGTEGFATAAQLKSKPYQSCGIFSVELYAKAGSTWGWYLAHGSGTLIKTVKEGKKYYDYILTASHNVRYGVFEKVKKLPKVRKYSRNINFYQGYSESKPPNPAKAADKKKITHAAADLVSVWIPYYYRFKLPGIVGGDTVDLSTPWTENGYDIAIIKYNRKSKASTTTAAYLPFFVLPQLMKNSQLRLIGYNPGRDGKQMYFPDVVPEPTTVKNAEYYEVNPQYTPYGSSGSGVFLEHKDKHNKWQVTTQVVGVHRGLTPAPTSGVLWSVHVKMTLAKRWTVREIIMNSAKYISIAIDNNFNNKNPAVIEYTDLLNNGYVYDSYEEQKAARNEMYGNGAMDAYLEKQYEKGAALLVMREEMYLMIVAVMLCISLCIVCISAVLCIFGGWKVVKLLKRFDNE